MADTFESTKVIEPGMGGTNAGFAFPVKHTNQPTGGGTSAFVANRQLQRALTGLAPAHPTPPTAPQKLYVYPLHEAGHPSIHPRVPE